MNKDDIWMMLFLIAFNKFLDAERAEKEANKAFAIVKKRGMVS